MSSPLHDDLGLQPERTGLAWSRTTVSFAIVLGLLGAHAYQHGRITHVLIITIAAAALLVAFSSPLAHWRTRHASRHLVAGTSPASISLLLLVTLIVVAASVVALVIILWTV
jgi:uncharacterized membrane protein YidH (DUF202 family)